MEGHFDSGLLLCTGKGLQLMMDRAGNSKKHQPWKRQCVSECEAYSTSANYLDRYPKIRALFRSVIAFSRYL
jgi:hypothetical protein